MSMLFNKKRELVSVVIVFMCIVFFMTSKSYAINVIKTSELTLEQRKAGLVISEDTKFIHDEESLSNKYINGIQIAPNKTLTIQLKGKKNLYVYGQKETKLSKRVHNVDKEDYEYIPMYVSHAGIEVPPGAKLIIEQIAENAGYLIVVGAGSNTSGDQARGTGAGIGGNGYDFENDGSSDTRQFIDDLQKYNYGNCGTVIIRSGRIYACGGCAIGTTATDAFGTGAGIGGGGIYTNLTLDSNNSNSSLYSGKGGDIRIYGGDVIALGGGTLDSEDGGNIYYANKHIFFYEGLGFPIKWSSVLESRADDAKGLGAGIGGGGIYAEEAPNVYVQNEMSFCCYTGEIIAVAGVGSQNQKIRGGGAAIGGGGVYTASNDEKKVSYTGTITLKKCNGYTQEDTECANNASSRTAFNAAVPAYYETLNNNGKIKLYRGRCGDGPGAAVGYGGYCYKNWAASDTNGNGLLTNAGATVSWSSSNLYLSNKDEAFSDYEAPTITFSYAVAKEGVSIEGLNFSCVAQTYNENLSDAISAAMSNNTRDFENGKIYKGSGYKIFVKATIQEGGSIPNKDYMRGKSGIYSIIRDTTTVDWISIINSTNTFYSFDDNNFTNGKSLIKDVTLETCANNLLINDDYVGSCALYFVLNENNSNSTIQATDLTGNTSSQTVNVLSSYIDIDYGEEQTVPTGLPGICDIKNPTSDGYDYVYLGATNATGSYYKNSSPIKWRVLNTTSNSNAASPALFMLSEYALIDATASGENGQIWSNSALRKFLFTNVYKDCFNEKEKNTMHLTTKSETGNTSWLSSSRKRSGRAGASQLAAEKIFLLSAKEALDNNYKFKANASSKDENKIAKKGDDNGAGSEWWLRSACLDLIDGETSYVSTISTNGDGDWQYDTAMGVRPALNIPLSHIICAFDTSDSGGAKEITTLTPPTNNTYRLTIYDSARSGFSINNKISAEKGSQMTINYSGATTGSNEYISVAIKNNDGGEECRYLGRYSCTVASGEIKATLPTDIAVGTYTIIVYNEHNQFKNRTNYAGFSIGTLTVLEASAIQVTLSYNTATPDSTAWTDFPENGVESVSDVYVKACVPIANATMKISPTTGDTSGISIPTSQPIANTGETCVVYKFTKTATFTITVSQNSTTIATKGGTVTIGDEQPSVTLAVTLGYASSASPSSWETSTNSFANSSYSTIYVKAEVPTVGATISISPTVGSESGITAQSKGSDNGKTYVIYAFTKNVEFEVRATKTDVEITSAKGSITIITDTQQETTIPEPAGLPGWWDIGDSQVVFGKLDPSKSYHTQAENGSATAKYENMFNTQDITPMYWSVIDNKANDDNNTQALFMYYGGIAKRRFDNTSNNWVSSELKSVLQNEILNDCFGDGEIRAMLDTTKTESQQSNWSGEEKASPCNLSKEKIFLLSANEILNQNYGFINTDYDFGYWENADNKGCYLMDLSYGNKWWLRSKISSANVAIIDDYYTEDVLPSATDVYVNPAINIKASYIICAINAYDDGTGYTGTYYPEDGDQEEVAFFEDINESSPGSYRLTIYDGNRKAFKVSETSVTAAPDGYIRVNYSNAQTGDDEYISAVIKELGLRATIKHQSESGSILFQLPYSIDEGNYTLIVYNEQNNGREYTNYGRHSIVTLTVDSDAQIEPDNPDNPDIPDTPGGATDSDLVEPTHKPSPVSDLNLTITVASPTISTVTINNITATVANMPTLVLKDTNKGFTNVNWDLNKAINWDVDNGISNKLTYKDVGTTSQTKDKVIWLDNTSNMDVVATINSKAQSGGYVVANYGANEATVPDNKAYTVGSGSSTQIKNGIKDYMYLVQATGSTDEEKEVTLQKTGEGTTIADVPYVVNGNIYIDSCTQSGNDVTVVLKPSGLITGQHIKEVGVRAEYTQNGVTASRVKKTNQINGNSYTFTFANLPSNPKFTAYYINTDNEEISKEV